MGCSCSIHVAPAPLQPGSVTAAAPASKSPARPGSPAHASAGTTAPAAAQEDGRLDAAASKPARPGEAAPVATGDPKKVPFPDGPTATPAAGQAETPEPAKAKPISPEPKPRPHGHAKVIADPCVDEEESPQHGEIEPSRAGEDEVMAHFNRFDFNEDGMISREEMLRAVGHLGLVPFGEDGEKKAQELLASLKAGQDGAVTKALFRENFGAVKEILEKSEVDFDKANKIAEELRRELSSRGCLLAEGEAQPPDQATADRAVSLKVLLALQTAVAKFDAYDLPTFNCAVRALCTTATGDPVRFAQLLSPQHVGPPNAFASHMWTAPLGRWPGERPFTYLAGQILHHYSAYDMPPGARAGVKVWVDLFAVSQHPGREQHGDLDNLERAVEAAARHDGTLLVLDPLGLTLTRIWCLLEIWVTATGDRGAEGLTILSKDMKGEALKEVFVTLDVEKAQATSPGDRERIMERVRASTVGVGKLNRLIKGAVVGSAEAEARRHQGGEGEAAWEAFEKLAKMLYRCTEEFERAEELYRRALDGKEKALGPDHTDTLRTVGDLATLLRARDDLDGAEKMFRRALEGQEKALGPDHTDTLVTIGSLATLLRARGDLDGAEKMHRRTLDGMEKALGPDHTDTLVTVVNLANLLYVRRDLDGAEEMYRRALDGKEKALGRDHPNTLVTVSNLALLLHYRGDLDGAEEMFRRALDGKEKALGRDHTDTLRTVGKLACLLSDRGDLDGAEKMFCRALEGMEKALGRDHNDTLRTVGSLAILLGARGDLDGAEKLRTRFKIGYPLPSLITSPGADASHW